jgi:inner membrane protein
MYILAHVGITLGAALAGSGVCNFISSRLENKRSLENFRSQEPTASISPESHLSITSLARTLGSFLDIRFLIIGSMLPDIIDKPLGHAFFANGRIISHTLLFAALLLILGGYFNINYKNKWLLGLGIGTFAHLILDTMWTTPRTLFWPLYGWLFPKYEETDWIAVWVSNLSSPSVFIPELIGGAIILIFIVLVVYQRRTLVFLKKGTL